MDASEVKAQKTTIEELSKEEIINKYKSLLNLAKKAKQAKDELAEENRKLKETLASSETQKNADKKALITMKEMLEQFTENKLQLTTRVNELEEHKRADNEALQQLNIENESLKRQLARLNEDNEALLADIDRMEEQLKQVNLIGIEQRKHLSLLEPEVNKLKEYESQVITLENDLKSANTELCVVKAQEQSAQIALEELNEKYKMVKEINSEQCKKFNSLKDRFIDVYRKLKKLKECKCILLESQHEYYENVSKWQKDIVYASHMLCAQINKLKQENEELLEKQHINKTTNTLASTPLDIDAISLKLAELYSLSQRVLDEHKEQSVRLEINANNNDNTNSENKIKKQKLEIQRLQQELQDLKAKISDSTHKINALQNENETMRETALDKNLNWKKENHSYKENIHKLNEQLQIIEKDLAEEKSRYKEMENQLRLVEQENNNLIEQLNKQTSISDSIINENTHDKSQSYEELEARFVQKEREHTDLLDEMRELNEVLKARGDVISRQQEKQQELNAEIKKITTKLQQTEEKLAASQIQIKEQEDQHNIFNLELEGTHKRIEDLENALCQSEDQLRQVNEELQTLRNMSTGEIDAQSDVLSIASAMSRADELNRLRDVEDSFEEKYNKLRSLAVKLKKKLQEQTALVNEMEHQQRENSNNNALQTELDEAKELIASLETKQEQLQKQLATIKTENQKLKSSRKQSNVLNLEIEAAEKSLNEVTTKLAAKINEVESQKATITTQETTIKQLRREIEILESAKAAECAHSKELKAQIDLLQNQIKDAVHSQQTTLLSSKELEQSLEQIKLEGEELRLQLACAVSNHEKALITLQADKSELADQLQQANNTIQQQQITIKTTERSLEDLRVLYLEYKVKAQAVLRKNQSRDTTKEHELEEELFALRQAEKKWQNTTQEHIKKIGESDKQIELLNEDVANLQRRGKELLNVVEELRQQYESLALENQRLLQTQQESLRLHRQQIEQLDAYHKVQLEELEAKQQQKLEELKAEHAKVLRLPPIIGSATTTRQHAVATPLTTDQSKIDFLLMEREDAEGSEEAVETLAAKRKISNASRRSQHDFMPLDELLNAPMQSISDTITTITAHSLGGSIDGRSDETIDNNIHMELQLTKERLHVQESRVRHLTALLAENEQDLAKLTQMNDMLKEELRRQERAVEREQHMHNAEYLKNVILKFLTLNNVDEKMRLVPVLNTILRLSRSEAELLNNAAKGQKVAGDRSWSSYLTSWTGGGNANNPNNPNSFNNN